MISLLGEMKTQNASHALKSEYRFELGRQAKRA